MSVMSDPSTRPRLPPVIPATLDAFVAGVRREFRLRVVAISLFGS
jgi:hypothetical protein